MSDRPQIIILPPGLTEEQYGEFAEAARRLCPGATVRSWGEQMAMEQKKKE